jgi:hypothetical protein
MNKKIQILTMLCFMLIIGNVQAATGAGIQSSYEEAMLPQEQTMKSQVWGLSPQLGLFSFTERNDNYTSRFAVGLGYDLNLAPAFWEKSNLFFVGLKTGFLYSHLGGEGSNMLGNNGPDFNQQGANLLSIPIDLKVGYHLTDSFRLSARTGGNVIYRSIAKSIDLGPGSNSSEELWKIYPNAGLDAEFQVNKNLSLVASPDMTFTTGKNIFVATIGATIMGY